MDRITANTDNLLEDEDNSMDLDYQCSRQCQNPGEGLFCSQLLENEEHFHENFSFAFSNPERLAKSFWVSSPPACANSNCSSQKCQFYRQRLKTLPLVERIVERVYHSLPWEQLDALHSQITFLLSLDEQSGQARRIWEHVSPTLIGDCSTSLFDQLRTLVMVTRCIGTSQQPATEKTKEGLFVEEQETDENEDLVVQLVRCVFLVFWSPFLSQSANHYSDFLLQKYCELFLDMAAVPRAALCWLWARQPLAIPFLHHLWAGVSQLITGHCLQLTSQNTISTNNTATDSSVNSPVLASQTNSSASNDSTSPTPTITIRTSQPQTIRPHPSGGVDNLREYIRELAALQMQGRESTTQRGTSILEDKKLHALVLCSQMIFCSSILWRRVGQHFAFGRHIHTMTYNTDVIMSFGRGIKRTFLHPYDALMERLHLNYVDTERSIIPPQNFVLDILNDVCDVDTETKWLERHCMLYLEEEAVPSTDPLDYHQMHEKKRLVREQVDRFRWQCPRRLLYLVCYPFLLSMNKRTALLRSIQMAYTPERLAHRRRLVQDVVRVDNGLMNMDLQDIYNPLWDMLESGLIPPVRKIHMSVGRTDAWKSFVTGTQTFVNEDAHNLRLQLRVEFHNEMAQDGGGVSREFFQLAVEHLLQKGHSIVSDENRRECQTDCPFQWMEEAQTYWFTPRPNMNIYSSELGGLKDYTQAGLLFGMALRNGIHVNLNFPMIMYRKLMGQLPQELDDLRQIDPSLSRGLQELLDYTGPESVENMFCLTFRIQRRGLDGTVFYEDLCPDGESLQVTKSNRSEFVKLYVDHLLNTSVEAQFISFRVGFYLILSDTPIYFMFQPAEWAQLLCGSKENDFHALERWTIYSNGYHTDHSTIRLFWSVVHDVFNEEERKLLLQFTTGSDRIPLGGMRGLNFHISRAPSDIKKLPSAHTCFNLLVLPEYTCSEDLLRGLRTAVNYSRGFGFI